jgi:hypothetical protein
LIIWGYSTLIIGFVKNATFPSSGRSRNWTIIPRTLRHDARDIPIRVVRWCKLRSADRRNIWTCRHFVDPGRIAGPATAAPFGDRGRSANIARSNENRLSVRCSFGEQGIERLIKRRWITAEVKALLKGGTIVGSATAMALPVFSCIRVHKPPINQ